MSGAERTHFIKDIERFLKDLDVTHSVMNAKMKTATFDESISEVVMFFTCLYKI